MAVWLLSHRHRGCFCRHSFCTHNWRRLLVCWDIWRECWCFKQVCLAIFKDIRKEERAGCNLLSVNICVTFVVFIAYMFGISIANSGHTGCSVWCGRHTLLNSTLSCEYFTIVSSALCSSQHVSNSAENWLHVSIMNGGIVLIFALSDVASYMHKVLCVIEYLWRS